MLLGVHSHRRGTVGNSWKVKSTEWLTPCPIGQNDLSIGHVA